MHKNSNWNNSIKVTNITNQSGEYYVGSISSKNENKVMWSFQKILVGDILSIVFLIIIIIIKRQSHPMNMVESEFSSYLLLFEFALLVSRWWKPKKVQIKLNQKFFHYWFLLRCCTCIKLFTQTSRFNKKELMKDSWNL